MVTMHDMELEQLDVKTAFFLGDLVEQIYVQQSKGFKNLARMNASVEEVILWLKIVS